MKRDCGKGELIPIRYSISWNVGNTDKEQYRDISSHLSKDFDYILATLPPLSNIRMYVHDKEGYCNCIRSTYIDSKGVAKEVTNRLEELGKE